MLALGVEGEGGKLMLILRLRLILTVLINISLFIDLDLLTDFYIGGLTAFKFKSLTVKIN